MIILTLRWVLIRENKAKQRVRAELAAAAAADEDADDLKATGGPKANDTTFSDLTCVPSHSTLSRRTLADQYRLLLSSTLSDKQNPFFSYVY